ncbi:TPP2 [Mytilus coruscus]|uniref:TPP2 n=1 Tax=Mytilus coruscus TaxID=42192 RepID=A0A6J8D9J3_MYTCO|nr:TPP2 [Mytilus coruscus]
MKVRERHVRFHLQNLSVEQLDTKCSSALDVNERERHNLSVEQLDTKCSSALDVNERERHVRFHLQNLSVEQLDTKCSLVVDSIYRTFQLILNVKIERHVRFHLQNLSVEQLDTKCSLALDVSERERHVRFHLQNLSVEQLDTKCSLALDVNERERHMSHFTVLHARANQQYGRALKLLLKQSEDKSTPDMDKKCIEMYKKLGWTHFVLPREKSEIPLSNGSLVADGTSISSALNLESVKAFCSVLEEMGKPFMEQSDDLLILDTRDIVDPRVAETVRKVEEIGKEQFHKFVTERLQSYTKSIYEPNKQNKLFMFIRQQLKTNSREKQQISSLKQNCSLFSQLYVSCQVRNGDLVEFFRHEHQAYPPSL